MSEYLNEEYVDNFSNDLSEDPNEYVNKIEYLASKKTNLLLRNSTTRKYVINNGKAYYLINKASLPDEIKSQIKGGDTSNPSDFSRLIDVYGVTYDLQVFYSSNDGNVTGNSFADVEDVNPNLPLTKANTDTAMNEILKTALNEIGITVDDDLGITFGNVSSLNKLTIDGSLQPVSNLQALAELTSLEELTLKNLTLNDLSGLEGASQLNYIYFYNCDISDYTSLASAYYLKYLYFYIPSSMNETTANKQISELGTALSTAKSINNLEHLYITGNLNIFGAANNAGWRVANKGFFNYSSTGWSNLSDISGLELFADNIKKSLKYLYLNNHKITSIASLSDFTNLVNVICPRNLNLTSLVGLENKSNLLYIAAQYCNLSNLEGISGDSKLSILMCHNNSNLISISGLKTCSRINKIRSL